MKRQEIIDLVVNELGCKNVVKDKGDWINCTCPIHRDIRPSFGVSVRGVGHPWNCFVCGGGRSLISLVSRARNISNYEAESIIRRYGDFEIPDIDEDAANCLDLFKTSMFTDEFSRIDNSISVSLYKKIYENQSIKPYHVFSYLETWAQLIKYDKKSDRFTIPFTSKDKVIGVVSVSPKGCKKSAKLIPFGDFSHKTHLYYPRNSPASDRLFVTESISDAIALREIGCKAVAVNGVSLTEPQIEEIRRKIMPSCIVCCGDADEAGNSLNIKLRKTFQEMTMFKLNFPSKKDVSDLNKADRVEAIKNMLYFSL